MPGTLWGEPQLIKFEDLHIVHGLQTRSPGGAELIARKNKTFADRYLDRGIGIPFGKVTLQQSWSFWVWYMDRNRPLPFGDAFDDYRERDYERCEAEGFPAPLHPSNIEIPEYNTDKFDEMEYDNSKVQGRFKKSLRDYRKEKS